MTKEEKPLYEEKKPKVFLYDAYWASGKFATAQQVDECIRMIKKKDHKKRLNEKECILIETSINYLALEIIRFSASSWSNNYYGAVDCLGDITSFLDKYF